MLSLVLGPPARRRLDSWPAGAEHPAGASSFPLTMPHLASPRDMRYAARAHRDRQPGRDQVEQREARAMAGNYAVLGGGVLGLTASLRLAQRGDRVTVFEREALPGGLA